MAAHPAPRPRRLRFELLDDLKRQARQAGREHGDERSSSYREQTSRFRFSHRRHEGAQLEPLERRGIRSILEYGAAASGAERAAASAAARSFFDAVAIHNDATVCAGIRAQLQSFLKLKHVSGSACTGVLKKLLVSPKITATAGKAAHARVSSVRIKGITAFRPLQVRGRSSHLLCDETRGTGLEGDQPGAWASAQRPLRQTLKSVGAAIPRPFLPPKH